MIDLQIVFNRFEQQKYNTEKARPLFIQFMDQIDEDLIPLSKVRGSNLFSTDLVGENAIYAGRPGRELLASLIMKMMNEHIGIFTFNPNRNHEVKHTNQEDLYNYIKIISKFGRFFVLKFQRESISLGEFYCINKIY